MTLLGEGGEAARLENVLKIIIVYVICNIVVSNGLRVGYTSIDLLSRYIKRV